MTRYKSQLRASRVEQEYPHHVDILVPPGGLGTRLDVSPKKQARNMNDPSGARCPDLSRVL
jgi:hypothetical protein